MKSRKPKFKGFRRKHWFVGDVAQREAHGRAESIVPLTRTWREGEPVMRVKGWLKP